MHGHLENRLDEIDCVDPHWAAMGARERKVSVQALVGRIIGLIESERREPDEWESGHLSAAIRSIRLSAFRVARVSACRAVLPEDQRVELPASFDERTATTADLRRRLDVARVFGAVRLPSV